MTIDAPVGTVTTYQFDPSGAIEDWVVPFHDGAIRVECVGGAGARGAGHPDGAGGGGGRLRGLATIAAGSVLHIIAGYAGENGGGPALRV